MPRAARNRAAPLRLAVSLLGVLAAAALASLVACDAGSLSAPSLTRCVAVADQCQLESGPLGVCERAVCAAGEAAPCFQCTPQH